LGLPAGDGSGTTSKGFHSVNIALWIASALIVIVLLPAAAVKLVRSKAALQEQMKWAEDFSAVQVKLIATLEVLGSVGLFVPVLTGILPILTPLAAVGLAILQIGATIVHVRRGEAKGIGINLFVVVLAIFVAVFRLLGY
jgi:DoxX-like family